jgi:hypothetical protein
VSIAVVLRERHYLYFDDHGAVCRPRDNGDSGSANCETLLPVKKFSFDLFRGPEF